VETAKQRMNAVEWLLLVVLSVIWGGSFLFNGIAVRSMPPLSIVAARVTIAALALHLLLAVRDIRFPREFRLWRAFLMMGILNNAVPFSLIVWGQTRIGAGLASILNATTPLFTVLIAHAATRDERLSPLRGAGIALGFVGATVIIGPDALLGIGSDVVAQLAVLMAACSYATAAVFGRRFSRMGIRPLPTATGQLTASSLVLLPAALIVDQPWNANPPGPDAIVALLGLGLLSSALAYIVYFRILSTAGATNVLLVTFLVPVTALLLGALILDEILVFRHLVGMALIGLGLAAIDGRLFRRLLRIAGLR
jgi:drug/metabolite transporter (DMT)-like permease